MDINVVMKSLSRKRGIFHLEADFQFALAWEIKSIYQDYEVRLEVPFSYEKKGYIDIIVRCKDTVYPIELKYLKKALKHTLGDEQFILAEGVHDMDMYNCIGDIERMEYLCSRIEGFRTGYVVWLTNDRAYWESNYKASYYKDFHAPNGAIKTGKMYFDAKNPKTQKPPQILQEKKYKNPITLNGSYNIQWNEYSLIGNPPKTQFMYAVIGVDKYASVQRAVFLQAGVYARR